jgi:hypothetical protein
MGWIRLAFDGYGRILCTAASSARTPFAKGRSVAPSSARYNDRSANLIRPRVMGRLFERTFQPSLSLPNDPSSPSSHRRAAPVFIGSRGTNLVRVRSHFAQSNVRRS